MAVLVIGERDVRELLPMRDCIEVMQRTFATLAESGFVQPPRIIAWQPDNRGAIAAMPAWLGEPLALGAKLISVFPQNRQAGIESHQGFVVLFESEHGAPRAIVHAGAVTAIRTAAVSGVATRLLANDNASQLAILGSGVQAHAHLHAMREVRPIRRVRVWSRSFEHAEAFARETHGQHGLHVTAVRTAREAIEGAEIICTVSAATAPILEGAWLAGGEHINAVGSSVPPFRELDTEVVVRARVFVDSFESARTEPDDLRVPIAEGAITEAHLLADLAQLAGGARIGRTARTDITLFKSVGLAIEDLAAIHAIYERAVAQGRGTSIDL
jgi:ornithine cyclodeaminase